MNSVQLTADDARKILQLIGDWTVGMIQHANAEEVVLKLFNIAGQEKAAHQYVNVYIQCKIGESIKGIKALRHMIDLPLAAAKAHYEKYDENGTGIPVWVACVNRPDAERMIAQADALDVDSWYVRTE